MIGGDLFMMLIGLILIFDEEMFLFGMAMLVLLGIDIYLTIDYIRSLKHREKVENSLMMDNLHASEIRQRYDELSMPKKPAQRRRKAQQPQEEEEEAEPIELEDLSALQNQSEPQNQQLRR